MELIPFYFSWLPIFFIALIALLFKTEKSRKSIKAGTTTELPLPTPPGSLPFVGHLHLLCVPRVTLFRTLGSMADTCGPIFSLRLGQCQAIVLSSWEVVRDCFTNNDAIIATRPSLEMSEHLFYNYAAFTNSPYGRYWREIRKISTVELLSIKRLEQMKHVREFEVNSFLKNLYQEYTKESQPTKVSLNKFFEYTTFNIGLAMIVGKRFSPQAYEEKGAFASRFKKAIARATYLAGIPVPSDFILALRWMDLLGYIGSMKEVHREIDVIIGHWLDEHIERRKECHGGFKEGDFMDVLLSNIGDGFFMSGYNRETIIKATALTLLLTSTESTSITLTWAISLLLNNPKVLKLAQQEMDLQVGKQRWVKESDITNLPYLRAIVKETLRLYPPSPLTGPREATEDCHVSRHLVPKGTRVIVNIWKLHRDPRVWVWPDEFRPERFLDDEHENVDFRGQSFEYIPFSLGRRSCPGMNFGLQVVHLMLARLIQGFDIWAEDGEPIDMSEDLGLALPKAGPLDAAIVPRLATKLYECL